MTRYLVTYSYTAHEKLVVEAETERAAYDIADYELEEIHGMFYGIHGIEVEPLS